MDEPLVIPVPPRMPERDSRMPAASGLLPMQATQWRALARLLPHTDVFHFYFGLTLVPKSLQFPILRALRKKSVFHYLGSDIRGKTPAELAYGKRADIYFIQNDYQGGLDFIRKVAKPQHPDAPEVLEKEALILWATGDKTGHIVTFASHGRPFAGIRALALAVAPHIAAINK